MTQQPRNTMSFQDRTRLTVWLNNNKGTLENNSDAKAAEIATTSLKFRVTTANIAALRNVLFPDMERKSAGSPTALMIGAMTERLNNLESRLASLELGLGVKPA